MLATSKRGSPHRLCGPGVGAASGRRNLAEFKPLQDLPEFPQQPHCDGQKPSWRVAVVCLPRMTLDGIAAFRMLSQGQWRQFLAVGKAHGAFYLALPRVLRQRAILRRLASPKAELVGWWSQSVIWAHFVQGSNARATTAPFGPLLNSEPTSVQWSDTSALAGLTLVCELDRCTWPGHVERLVPATTWGVLGFLHVMVPLVEWRRLAPFVLLGWGLAAGICLRRSRT